MKNISSRLDVLQKLAIAGEAPEPEYMRDKRRDFEENFKEKFMARYRAVRSGEYQQQFLARVAGGAR